MFEKVLITDEERQMFPKWTVLDEDLADVDPVLAEQVLESRLEFFRGDISRTDYWHDPEGIDVIADIQYVDDGTRAHRLDLYLPHDSVVRGSKTTPVYIDIHGGGFVYGLQGPQPQLLHEPCQAGICRVFHKLPSRSGNRLPRTAGGYCGGVPVDSGASGRLSRRAGSGVSYGRFGGWHPCLVYDGR